MGGAEIHFHEIFKRIASKGHNITLVAHHFDNAPREEIIDGIKTIRIGNKYLFHLQFKRFYKSQLIKNNYDLVVDDISKIPLNTPAYIKEPLVGILHHIHGKTLIKEIPYALAYYLIYKEKRIPKDYKKTPIFTVSNSTRSELIRMGFDKNLTSLLHNAIDHELFDRVEIEKNVLPLIVYVGRIKKYKNIHYVIEAMPELIKIFPKIKLVIGGRGDYQESLKNSVKNLNLGNSVEFFGFLSEEEKARILGKAWIFVTMAEKEGWGITVIEANAMKTPAIGSDVEGLRDSIRNNVTGFLVKLGDKKQLVAKISDLLKNGDELNRVSENAYKWSKEFDWDKSADHFLDQIVEWYPSMKSKI